MSNHAERLARDLGVHKFSASGFTAAELQNQTPYRRCWINQLIGRLMDSGVLEHAGFRMIRRRDGVSTRAPVYRMKKKDKK